MKNINALHKLGLAVALTASAAWGQMNIVNGASFNPNAPMAPGSFATMFGQNLCSQTVSGDWIAPGQLPTTLGGCSVMVNGTSAMMSYASPTQINFIVPANMGPGTANVVVNSGSGMMNGTMAIGQSGPGMFALNGMGMGEGAMLHGSLWQMGPFSTTTNGQPTPVSMFMTGLDLSSKPVASIGGMPVEVTFYGAAPGYAGLQQINIMIPPNMAGVGRVPVTVTSGGQVSNVTFMHMLPTTAMMQGMPGFGQGMMVAENMGRAREMSYLAVNPANNTALVTDENDDALRIISLSTGNVTDTITLPSGSQAHGVAVNAAGTLAAVVLSAKDSVALIDLNSKAVSVIGTGDYPSHAIFSGSNLLVTNGASGTVSVIDSASKTLSQTVQVGFGPSGIAAAGNIAVIANLQEGSISLINLSANFAVTKVALPAGTRPYAVAVAAALNKAVISLPMENAILLLDLSSKAISKIDLSAGNGVGPGAIAVNGNLAFVANQMTASVTVVDLAQGKALKTFAVDPGPRSLDVNPLKNQLLVLAEGTGTLDVVDLSSYAVSSRINAGDSAKNGTWTLPLISSLSPNTAAAGATFTLTITGTNLQSVQSLEFHVAGSFGAGSGMGGGMGGGMGQGMGLEDTNIKITNFQKNSAGTQITCTVQILATDTPGARQVRLETSQGEVMGMMGTSYFTITK